MSDQTLIKFQKSRQVQKYKDTNYRHRMLARWGKSSPDECELKSGSFFSYVLDMYADPGDIQLRSVPNGREGVICDKARMKSYYVNALRSVDLEAGKKQR